MSTPRRQLAGGLAAPFGGTARFEVRRVLGAGGMGVVYDAFDRERGIPVALKTLRWVDAQSIFRLKTEFRARADLEHRNLVRLGDLHHEDGHWFFTMELVDGTTFLDWVCDDAGAVDQSGDRPLDRRRCDERRLRAALRQLAAGLDALHRAGMVHRDLKPSNVMVTPEGRVVLLDFGLVAEASAQLSDTSIVGTAAYMSPEQAMSRPAGPPADWYSVGVMMYEALTGRVPIEGPPLDVLMRKQHRRPPRRVADAPEDLSALCVALLAIDPEARPTGAEVLRRLAAPVADDRLAATPFVGRRDELAVLEAALGDVTRGATLAICLEGESGIGKTKLVRHFVEGASARPDAPLVLAGRCHERESVPFKGLDGVIDALARALARREEIVLPPAAEVSALAETFPVLMRVPAIARLGAPLPPNLLERRARAFRGLRRLLEGLAAERPLLVAIDDIQWADPDTLMLLGELVHGPGAPRILVVLTRRGDGAAPVLPIPVTTLRLAPLSDAEAAELVERIAPERAGEREALIAGAGGHPMFLRELLRHGAATARGARLDDALWGRITRMHVAARRVLELVAVASRPLPQALVAEALGLDGKSAAKWFGILRAASLVRTGGTRGGDPVEPYHDRVRDAVLARIAPGRRRRYHARLAALLVAHGHVERDPGSVVEHLEAAGQRVQAAEIARRAAQRATGALAFEQQAALCAAVLRLSGGDLDPEERRELLARRAEALACAGRGTEAARWYRAAAEGATDAASFQLRRAAAEQLLVSGRVHEGLELLAEVLAEIGERIPRAGAPARRSLLWHWARLALRGTRFRERPAGGGERLDQLRLDVYRTASLGLGLVDAVTGAVFQARAALVALRVGDRRRIAYALAYHAMYVGAAGGRFVDDARALVAQSREIAEACQSPFLRGWARCGEGVVEYFAGNFARAVEALIDAEAQMREHTIGTAPELNHLRMFQLFAMRRHGHYDRMRAHYLEYVRDATRRGDRYATTSFLWSANTVWLAADDPARARADLAAGTWSPPEQGLHLQHWWRARARAEIALYEGDPTDLDAAERELAGFHGGVLAHVQVVRAETALELGRIAILRGDAAGARRALTKLRRERAPYLVSLALLIRAAADVLDGRRDRARRELAEAAALADAAGMEVIAALARRRRAELDGAAAGIAAADEVLHRHGVVAPERFARAFATWPAT